MQMISNRDAYRARKPAGEVTAAYEDAGLFKTAICELMVEFIPLTRRNDRHDLVVRGFVDRKTEVDFFFAGRRVADVGPLEAQLKALMSIARQKAANSDRKPPEVEKIRLPLRVEGAWRRALQRDDSGWETGTYHFVVARWSLLDNDGNVVSFGEAPVFEPGVRDRMVAFKAARPVE
ncbi:MAG: hypothetical protein AAF665_18340 [Pseudomonadota bacterium]